MYGPFLDMSHDIINYMHIIHVSGYKTRYVISHDDDQM